MSVIIGDCLTVMPTLAACSVDAIVCDPPYHLTTGKKGGSGPASVNLESPYGRARITTGFMGKAWDGGDVALRSETWAEALRVAKPRREWCWHALARNGRKLGWSGESYTRRAACIAAMVAVTDADKRGILVRVIDE